MTSRMNPSTQNQTLSKLSYYLLHVLNGTKHKQALLIYMFIAAGHFSEHLVQIFQYVLLDWSARESGGILGLWLPGLAESEVLHSTYNSFQLTGLILLAYGFRNAGRARTWWIIALVAQSWHWLEHAILQVQYLTGFYLYNAVKQTSVLEFFFPRIELHFVYNLLVFTPTVIALVLYFRQSSTTKNNEMNKLVIKDIEKTLEETKAASSFSEKLKVLNNTSSSARASQVSGRKQNAVLQLASFAQTKTLFLSVEREFLTSAGRHFQQSGELSTLHKAYINRLYKEAKANGFKAN